MSGLGIKLGLQRFQVATLLNPLPPQEITADSTVIKCDNGDAVTVDSVLSTIREQFDAMNDNFTTLYT